MQRQIQKWFFLFLALFPAQLYCQTTIGTTYTTVIDSGKKTEYVSMRFVENSKVDSTWFFNQDGTMGTSWVLLYNYLGEDSIEWTRMQNGSYFTTKDFYEDSLLRLEVNAWSDGTIDSSFYFYDDRRRNHVIVYKNGYNISDEIDWSHSTDSMFYRDSLIIVKRSRNSDGDLEITNYYYNEKKLLSKTEFSRNGTVETFDTFAYNRKGRLIYSLKKDWSRDSATTVKTIRDGAVPRRTIMIETTESGRTKTVTTYLPGGAKNTRKIEQPGNRIVIERYREKVIK